MNMNIPSMQPSNANIKRSRAKDSIVNAIGNTAFSLISGSDGQRPLTGFLGLVESIKGFCVHKSAAFFGILAILIIITIIVWAIRGDVCDGTVTKACMPYICWGSIIATLIWGLVVPLTVGYYNYRRAKSYIKTANNRIVYNPYSEFTNYSPENAYQPYTSYNAPVNYSNKR